MESETIGRDEMLRVIVQYVEAERVRRNVNHLDTQTKPELSGEMLGEFNLLLDRQLISTFFGYGGWTSLEDEAVLVGVYQVVLDRVARQTSE